MQLTSKEKTLISDTLTAEEICNQKYKYYAANAEDQEVRDLFSNLAQQEDQHLQILNDALNGNFDIEAAQQSSSSFSKQSSGNSSKADVKMTNQKADMEIAKTAMSAKDSTDVEEFNDRQRLQDALMTVKHLSGNYDISVLEAANNEVFQTLEQLQHDKHLHKQEIFNLMNQKGWYSINPAQS